MIRSTLHAFWDLFTDLADQRITIYVDEATYPIASWGLTSAAARGTPVRKFRHQDPESLRTLLKRDRMSGRKPLVVSDGFCPDCGRVAPVKAFLSAVTKSYGNVILDDTQALGIFGHSPSSRNPYGQGGGGTLRFVGVSRPEVTVVESLAKGFGAPIAAVAGSAVNVRRFVKSSASRVHCSPPSTADLHAAKEALRINRIKGDRLRGKLLSLTIRLRKGLSTLDLSPGPTLFPMQVVKVRGLTAAQLHRDLLRSGIRAVMHQGKCTMAPRVSLLITASHQPEDIDRALAAIERSRSGKRRSHSYLISQSEGA